MTDWMVVSWDEAKARVLAKEPSAAPLLAVIEQYWGDGKLTEAIAHEFIALMVGGKYVEAKALLYPQMSAADLIASQHQANADLKEMLEAEKKIYNFLHDAETATLQIALGIVLALVGL